MAGSALRRLMAEYKRNNQIMRLATLSVCAIGCILNFLFPFFVELTLNPPEGIVAGPISEDNFFEWEALIA